MKVTTTDGKTFQLVRESEADHQLLDAIDMERCVDVIEVQRERDVGETFAFVNARCTLLVSRDSPQQLVVDAGRQALRSLGDLFRLGLREAALQRHVRPNPADPDPQKALTGLLEELQVMLHALSAEVLQRKPVVQEVKGHENSSLGGTTVQIPRQSPAASVGQQQDGPR